MLRLSSFLTGLFFAVGSSMCFAQTVEFPISFINVSPAGNKGQMFTFAAHPLATAEVDTALGEREIPSIPPPAGVFIVYTIPPSTEYLWLSPKDIRQMKPGIRFREDYDVNILWTGGTLDITWDYPMPELIDSAYLVDAFTDFPNNFVKVKIGPERHTPRIIQQEPDSRSWCGIMELQRASKMIDRNSYPSIRIRVMIISKSTVCARDPSLESSI